MTDRSIPVAFVDGARGSAIAQTATGTWPAIRALFAWPHCVKGDKLSAPAWLPVRLVDGAPMVRKDAHVAAVSCMVFDLDDGTDWVQAWEAVRALGLEAAIHTTWSHSPSKHKIRAVFPLAEDCPRDQWLEVWLCAEQWARTWGATIDPACKNPSRLYFLPSLPAAEWDERILWFRSEAFGGRALHWRWLQAHHAPPVAPVEAPTPPKVPQWTGSDARGLERADKRRRAYADGVLRGGLARIGPKGSRNRALYGAAKDAVRLGLAGALDATAALHDLAAAAASAGLSAREIETTLGSAAAQAASEGPWDFSTLQ